MLRKFLFGLTLILILLLNFNSFNNSIYKLVVQIEPEISIYYVDVLVMLAVITLPIMFLFWKLSRNLKTKKMKGTERKLNNSVILVALSIGLTFCWFALRVTAPFLFLTVYLLLNISCLLIINRRTLHLTYINRFMESATVVFLSCIISIALLFLIGLNFQSLAETALSMDFYGKDNLRNGILLLGRIFHFYSFPILILTGIAFIIPIFKPHNENIDNIIDAEI